MSKSKMNYKIELLQEGIYIGGVAFIGMVLFYNKQGSGVLLLCLCLMFLWGIERSYFKNKRGKYIYVLWTIQYSVILGICSREITGMSILLLLLMCGGIVLDYPVKKSLAITAIEWMGYNIMMRLKYGEQYNAYPIFMATMNFIIVYLLVSAIRYQMVQRERAQQTAMELAQKKEELEKAYQKLQQFYVDQEEIVVLKERTRIAGEIHDTVGHRLTTANIQLEAAKRLLDVDREKTVQKLSIAQGQVREGLQDIRQAVRAMKEGKSILSFEESISVFIDEVSHTNDIVIEREIEALPYLDSQIENTLFRGLQEGITNGIRHGKSKWFHVRIHYDHKQIQLSLTDKGEGNEHLIFGFGLHNMERKVKALNGNLEVISDKNKGTQLTIQLPMREDKI